jgi:glutamate racemase
VAAHLKSVVVFRSLVRVLVIDSGLGVVPTAVELRQVVPSADLVLAMDPDRMPWGIQPEGEVIDRLHLAVSAALATGPLDAVVVACNTASVLGLQSLRDRLEPGIPVVGTVPAVKPAAALSSPFAVWATVGTTQSAYLERLVYEFSPSQDVTLVACNGLAEAIESADRAAIADATARAVTRTPARAAAVVLACTHYPLVASTIADVLPAGTQLLDSRAAVVRQAVRRVRKNGALEASAGRLEVLLSGHPGYLPPAATAFAMTQALSSRDHAISDHRRPADRPQDVQDSAA